MAALAALGACATAPTGPTVAVLPGSGKTLDQFRADDSECQPYALAQARAARPSSYDVQRLYDLGYIQCMYAKGHRVPVLGPMAVRPRRTAGPAAAGCAGSLRWAPACLSGAPASGSP